MALSTTSQIRQPTSAMALSQLCIVSSAGRFGHHLSGPFHVGSFMGSRACNLIGCLDDIISTLIHVRYFHCSEDYTDRAEKGPLQQFDG